MNVHFYLPLLLETQPPQNNAFQLLSYYSKRRTHSTLYKKVTSCSSSQSFFDINQLQNATSESGSVQAPLLVCWSWAASVMTQHLGDENWTLLNIYLITTLNERKLFFRIRKCYIRQRLHIFPRFSFYDSRQQPQALSTTSSFWQQMVG